MNEGESMQDYQELTDEELIFRLRDGDSAVTDYIIGKYKDLVKSQSRQFFILGADHEDVLQEGMIGLFKAIRNYDPGRDASFQTFATLCINRQLCSAVQKADRKKHNFLNYYVSMYEKEAASDDGSIRKAPLEVLAPDWSNPENLLIDKENRSALEDAIEEELSDFEYQVLGMHMTGMDYKEIAAILMKEPKPVDNALQRAKKKVKDILKKYTASN